MVIELLYGDITPHKSGKFIIHKFIMFIEESDANSIDLPSKELTRQCVKNKSTSDKILLEFKNKNDFDKFNLLNSKCFSSEFNG